jgi:hypothetical protein
VLYISHLKYNWYRAFLRLINTHLYKQTNNHVGATVTYVSFLGMFTNTVSVNTLLTTVHFLFPVVQCVPLNLEQFWNWFRLSLWRYMPETAMHPSDYTNSCNFVIHLTDMNLTIKIRHNTVVYSNCSPQTGKYSFKSWFKLSRYLLTVVI